MEKELEVLKPRRKPDIGTFLTRPFDNPSTTASI
jgi:hypothetical protein